MPSAARVELHRRQFLLGPRPARIRDGWRTLELASSLHLSHCPTLPVSACADRDGGSWVLVGLALQTASGRPDPLPELTEATTREVERRTADWAGRWILIGEGGIHTDATGLLGCFYRTVEEGEHRGLWASSSPALLCSAVAPRLAVPEAALAHQHGLEWYAPPRSGIESVYRLLPSQKLELDGAERISRGPIEPACGLAYGEILAALTARLTTALRNAERTHGELWLPLSAGADSRLLLAAAVAAGVRVTAYTFDKPDELMSRADRELPPKLATAVGYDHVLIAPRELDPERLAVFDEHTARHTADIDRRFVACGQWDEVPEGVVSLGGGAFEVGRCYYYAKLPREMPPTSPEAAARVLANYPDATPLQRLGVREWCEWAHATGDGALDWRDRFYVEQRVAGWLSSIEQGIDVTGRQRVHVAGCASLLAELLAIPEEIRAEGLHHAHLIGAMAPGLSRFPVNPPASMRARVGRRVRREASLFRAHGSVGRYAASRLRRLWSRRSTQRAWPAQRGS